MNKQLQELTDTIKIFCLLSHRMPEILSSVLHMHLNLHVNCKFMGFDLKIHFLIDPPGPAV